MHERGAGPGVAGEGAVRLMGGARAPGYRYGRLEVFVRGFWSNVCAADGLTPASAQVACRALGFPGGAALEFSPAYSGAAASHVRAVADLSRSHASV